MKQAKIFPEVLRLCDLDSPPLRVLGKSPGRCQGLGVSSGKEWKAVTYINESVFLNSYATEFESDSLV